MIEGTGPGRGVPWWRSGRVLILRFEPGGQVPGLGIALGRIEPAGIQREGRLVTRIGARDE